MIYKKWQNTEANFILSKKHEESVSASLSYDLPKDRHSKVSNPVTPYEDWCVKKGTSKCQVAPNSSPPKHSFQMTKQLNFDHATVTFSFSDTKLRMHQKSAS